MSSGDEGAVSIGSGDEKAWQALEALIAGRVAEGLAGGLSTKGIDAIVEEELGRIADSPADQFDC